MLGDGGGREIKYSGGGLLADKIPASLRAIQFHVFEKQIIHLHALL
jgi:hypothetical protein